MSRQEKLMELADRIDSEKLWRQPAMDRDKLTPGQRDLLDAGVMLRRYADLLEPGRWLIFPPTGSIQFSAGTLEKVFEMAKRDEERKSGIAQATEAAKATSVAVGELPPLPEPTVEGSVMHKELKICYRTLVHFTADQMRAYGQQCAEDARQPAPVVKSDPLKKYSQRDMLMLHDLSRKLLWLAYVWNDHNFDAAHIEARETAKEWGIKSLDDANKYLENYTSLAATEEPVVRKLVSALNAMLTHMGMDEDDWNKPTFDQARAAITAAKEKGYS